MVQVDQEIEINTADHSILKRDRTVMIRAGTISWYVPKSNDRF